MELVKKEECFLNSEFRQDWNWLEDKGVEAVLDEWLKEELNIKETADEYFGLAYTSSSSYAMLSVCNANHYLEEGLKISHFAITNGYIELVIVCKDKEEKEYHFVLERG